MSPVFTLSIAKQKDSHPCIHVSYATIVGLCCIISICKNRITGFQDVQSYKTVFVACTCNILCTLHQSCLTKTHHLSTMQKPVVLPVTLHVSGRQTVGHSTLSTESRNTYWCGYWRDWRMCDPPPPAKLDIRCDWVDKNFCIFENSEEVIFL